MDINILKELGTALRYEVLIASALLTEDKPLEDKGKRLSLLKFLLKNEVRTLLPIELTEQKN